MAKKTTSSASQNVTIPEGRQDAVYQAKGHDQTQELSQDIPGSPEQPQATAQVNLGILNEQPVDVRNPSIRKFADGTVRVDY